MLVKDLPQKTKLKKALSLLFALSLPAVYYIDFTASKYLLMIYVAFVFYEADDFNIRFVIGLVAVEQMLSTFLTEVINTITVDILSLDDLTIEYLGTNLLKMALACLLFHAIFRRKTFVDWFKKSFDSNQGSRLIGFEISLLATVAAVIALHVVYIGSLLVPFINITDMDSLMHFYHSDEYKIHHNLFFNGYLVITMMQIFILQSFNYEVFRKQWSLRS